MIPDEVFRHAERTVKRLGVSRSELFTRAMREYLGATRDATITVVQDDLLTQSKLGTVMVVPLTTNLKRGLAAGNVTREPRETGLSTSSIALVCQVMTVDRAFFADVAGALPKRSMNKLNVGLRLALGLSA